MRPFGNFLQDQSKSEASDALTASGRAPVFARKVNAQAQKGGFLALYMCNFTVKWDHWETSLFGYRNSGACR